MIRNLLENIAAFLAAIVLLFCLGFFLFSAIFWAVGNVPV